jgi:hypothetical protein
MQSIASSNDLDKQRVDFKLSGRSFFPKPAMLNVFNDNSLSLDYREYTPKSSNHQLSFIGTAVDSLWAAWTHMTLLLDV